MSMKKKSYKVETNIIIQKIGQINTKNETFYAEFFIETKWTDNFTINDSVKNFKYDPVKNFNPNILLNNSVGEPYQEISYKTKILDGRKSFKRVEIVERRKVQGKFWQKFDFNTFPLDVQALTIDISSSSPSSQVELIESLEKFNFLSPKAFMDSQEWKIYSNIQTQNCIKKCEISSEEYSSFIIQISASRIPSYYLYNAFLLIFIITSVGLTRFTVSCDIPHVRLIIDTTVLLTLITFKWVIAEDIPQISYLTSLDKYILFSIVFIIGQSIYDSVIGAVSMQKCVMPYGQYDLNAFIVSLSILGLANILLIIWIIVIALRNKFDLYKHTKLSSDTNSERLYQIYNKDIGQTYLDDKEDTGMENTAEEKISDNDSVESLTIRL